MKDTNQNIKRIAILGMGGVGGYYGAMLAALAAKPGSNLEISFIARGEQLRKIKSEGLRVITPSRDFSVEAALTSDKAEKVGIVDYLILASKSYDLEAAIAEAMPMIGAQTVILPLLNGANIQEQIQELLPQNEVWYGCVYISARRAEPGLIKLEADRELFYFGAGKADSPSEREEEMLAWLTEAGIKAFNPKDIELYIQKKFVMISSVATATSYFDCSIGKVLQEHQGEMDKLLSELESLYAHMEFIEQTSYKLPADTMENVRSKQQKMPAESTSSMHSDFLAGNRTELENLTGWVVKKARQLGLRLPTYESMYEALKQKESREA